MVSSDVVSTRLRPWLRRTLPPRTVHRAKRLEALAGYEADRLRWAHRRGMSLRPRGTLLFYPTLPTPMTTAYRLAIANGLRITDDPEVDADAVIRWMDATVWHPDPALRSLAARRPVANIDADDLTKSRVNHIFGQTFGYELRVDPTTHQGQMLAKSERNAVHDGRIVVGPLDAPEPDVSTSGSSTRRRTSARTRSRCGGRL